MPRPRQDREGGGGWSLIQRAVIVLKLLKVKHNESDTLSNQKGKSVKMTFFKTNGFIRGFIFRIFNSGQIVGSLKSGTKFSLRISICNCFTDLILLDCLYLTQYMCWRDFKTSGSSRQVPYKSNFSEIFLYILYFVVSSRGGVFEPFMGQMSQVELTPPRPGQLGSYRVVGKT